ncbi:MAG: galactose-1-phosphate uridylyltransferase [Candidatus Omnitrophica bacterium]|nr:galactose-1-phosphate uridylyltransferase [Candidatus Omnitrophota bacterium]
MSEYRQDPISGRWIIINTDQPKEPKDFEKIKPLPPKTNCPFCAGHEALTPPEIIAIRADGTAPNTKGWSIRVIPNKFPALRVEGELDRAGEGIYDMMNGVGAHEVIIETPEHDKQLPDLPLRHIEEVLATYKNRILDLKNDSRFKYHLIFKNQGQTAGASLSHSHSQLIALPIVPKRVLEELTRAQGYYEFKERCVFCDMMLQELEERERIVLETPEFVCFAPFVSRFPFELWIMPKTHAADFAQISPAQTSDLARALSGALGKIQKSLGNPSYNFVVHTAPVSAHARDEYHWHIEMMPRLMRVAGFEWGSGFYINPTPPEIAARFLKSS